MTQYHFEKPTITPHTLDEQIKACLAKLSLRTEREKEQWIDTVPSSDEATAFDDLSEIRKAEIKRDKWNRDLTKE